MVKISIIMPVFNDECRLDKSITSFLNQTLKDTELLCVNDGSTDNSLKILNDYSSKYSQVKVFSQENQGSGKARNLGIEKASGEYIGFLDADDFFIDNDTMEKLYNVASKNNSNVVTGNIKLVNENDEFSPFTNFKYFDKSEIIKPEEYGIPWAFYKNIYKTSFLRENKIYFPDLLRGQDPVFLAEVLSKVDKIYTAPTDTYAYFYVNGANQCNTQKKRYDHMMHYKMVFDYLKDPKFNNIVHQFRYEMLGFIDMMGEDGGLDILNATREIFKEEGDILSNFEEIFYFKHQKDSLSDLVKLNKNPDKPKISVIVPVYNVEEFLNDSINSVLNQTFDDFEVICVNDGSKDNSLKILNEFKETDSRIKVIDKENGGCGSARNTALSQAKGKYIYFFDPDDIIPENTFNELYLNAILNNSDLVIFKIARFVDPNFIEYDSPYFDFDNVFRKVNFNRFTFNYKDVMHYVLNSAFAPWSKLYKKEFLDSYDDFKFDLGVAFDDVPFHVKSMLRANKISFVPKFLYYYRYQNQNSVNHTASRNIDIFKIFDIVESFLKNNCYFSEFEKEFYEFKLRHTLYYIISSNSNDYFKLANENFIKIAKEFVPSDISFYYNTVINSNSLDEYQLRLKINTLNKENIKLKNDLNKTKKDFNKFKNDIFTSNSWKITKPLRNFSNRLGR